MSKANDKRWRLIWNVSEVDRLLDAYIHGDQTHLDVLTHQGENGDLGSLAVGCGHDDEGLKRTYQNSIGNYLGRYITPADVVLAVAGLMIVLSVLGCRGLGDLGVLGVLGVWGFRILCLGAL